MYFKNILVPYDGSNPSKHAFKVALDFAKKFNSKITVISVISANSSGHWSYEARLQDKIISEESKQINMDFKRLHEFAYKDKIPFRSKILISGSASKKIADYAKSHKNDIVIMGSHGRGGLDRMVMGSVTEGVSRRIKCPILIIR